MIMTTFGALAPVFGIILLGYLSGRTKVLGDGAFEVLNRFVITITLPVLTFLSIARMPPESLLVPAMLIAVVGGALIAFGVGFLIESGLGRKMSEANIAGLCACFSNTGFIGLPIATLTFGNAAIAPVTVTMLLYSAVIFTLSVVLSEVAAHRDRGVMHGLRTAGRAVVHNPLIFMSSLGMAWSLLRLPLGGPVQTLLSTLAQATAACALTAIGLFISRPRRTASPGPIARAVFLKLVIHPLVTAGLVFTIAPMSPLWTATAVLMAAMPCGATSFVLAGKAGAWAQELSAWAVTLTTVLAAVTLLPTLWLVT
jgi:predicted permease